MTWRSKKKNEVACSRVEVEFEFRAMAHGIWELLCLKIILEDLKINWKGPMKFYYDKKSTIRITHNSVQHYRIKNIEVDRHIIKETFDSELIYAPFVSSQGKLADFLPKEWN